VRCGRRVLPGEAAGACSFGSAVPLGARGLAGVGRRGYSSATSAAPSAPPAIWAATNPPIEPGAMPAKVFVKARAIVTAGLAKLVDAVNQ